MQNTDSTVAKGGGRVEFSYEDMQAEYANTPPPAASKSIENDAELDKFPILGTNSKDTKPVDLLKEALSVSSLPDLRAATASPAKALAAARHQLQKNLEKKMSALVAAELSLPENAGLAAKPTLSTFVKAPATRPAVNEAILRHIFTVEGALGTQTSIRHNVGGEFPGETVNHAWTNVLTPWMLRKAEAIAGGNGSPFNTLKFKNGQTLSSLHKLARAAVAQSRGARHVYKATIAMDDEHLYINGHSFKLTNSTSKGYKYRAAKIQVATLRKVLDNPLS